MPARRRLPYHALVSAHRPSELFVIAGEARAAWPLAKEYEHFRPALLLLAENGLLGPLDGLELPSCAQEALVLDLVPLSQSDRVDFSILCSEFGCKRTRWVSEDGALQRIGPA